MDIVIGVTLRGGTLEPKDTGSFTSNGRGELVINSSRVLTAAESIYPGENQAGEKNL